MPKDEQRLLARTRRAWSNNLKRLRIPWKRKAGCVYIILKLRNRKQIPCFTYSKRNTTFSRSKLTFSKCSYFIILINNLCTHCVSILPVYKLFAPGLFSKENMGKWESYLWDICRLCVKFRTFGLYASLDHFSVCRFFKNRPRVITWTGWKILKLIWNKRTKVSKKNKKQGAILRRNCRRRRARLLAGRGNSTRKELRSLKNSSQRGNSRCIPWMMNGIGIKNTILNFWRRTPWTFTK